MTRPARGRRRRALPAGVLALLLLLTACRAATVAPEPGPTPYRAALTLGLAGPFTDATLRAAHGAGVSATLVEMTWRQAEPAAGDFDDDYVQGVRDQIDRHRADGFQVALNVGLQDAPQWLLDRPGGRFVDQHGTTFTGATVPNLVFGKALRAAAQTYLTHVIGALGNGVSLVRAGGGISGELSYPYVIGPDGLVGNSYWAYDIDARAADPVPGWRPGQASPHGEAGRFLDWYLGALVEFQNWQVQALRTAGYHGQVAVLYPSSGLRPGDVEAAVAGDLAGTTSPEVNGEVQRGYDFARQVAALTDPDVVVYGTWGENLGVVDYLAGLARARGLPVMAENAGTDPPDVLAGALHNAARLQLSAFYLIRASTLACACDGGASFDDVASTYRTLPRSYG